MKTHLDKSISHKPLLKKKNLISVYSILCVVILILSSASASFIVNIVDHNTQIEIRNNEIFIEKEEPDAMFFPDITTDKDPIFIGNTGYEPCYGYVGGIINSANGNLFISQTDMSVNARGFNIEIIRSYNSFNQNHSSGFGYGWTFNYNTYVIDYLEYVIWVDGDGSFHNFTHVGGGIYSAPPGVHFRLRKHGDNSYSLSARSGMKYRFDEYGILTYMYDINGNKLSFSYDGAKLIRVEDDSGLYIDISYNAVNKIKSIRNPLGHFVNYSYDQFNNLIRLIDPLGYSVWFQYYCCHRLGTIIDRVNNTVIISYDDSGKRVVDIRNSMYDEADQSHDNAFLIYLVLYDYDNDTVFFLDANNYPTRVKINDVGNLIEINDALNQTTFASWENNMITSITDPNGNTNRYEYDSYSNPIKRINPFGYETLYNWSIKDSTDQYLISLTDSINVEYTRGPQVQLFNDSLTSPINSSWALSSNWGPTWLDFHSAPNSYACKFLDPILNYGQGWDETMDSPGIILSGYIDAELTFWHRGDFEDDATIHDGGNIKVSTDGRNTWNLMTPDDGYDGKIAYSWGANPLEVERAFGYSFGWKKETVDLTSYVGMADNVSIRFEMGTNMNPTMDQGWFIDDVIVNAYTAVPQYIITSFSYDVNGNLLSVNDATGNSSSYVYDSYGNLLNTTDFRGYITDFEYDLYGNLVKIIDPTGNSSTYTYDSIGRLLNSSNSRGYTTSNTWDANDRLKEITDATDNKTSYEYNGNGGIISMTDANNHTTNYTHNVVGEIEEVVDATGNISIYKYSQNGDILGEIDAKGNETNIEYDPVGRPICVTDALGNKEWWGYDAVGNVVYHLNKLNYITNYEYDKLNRLTRTIDPLNGESVYIYDELGNLIDVKDENGRHSLYEYDALNRLVKIIGSAGCGCNEKCYRYDENGNRITYTDANGHTISYEYDALNRLIKQTDPTGNATSYAYDSVGNMIATTNILGYITNYTYDPINRLDTVMDALGNEFTYDYDAVGNLLQITNKRGYNTDFEYDKLNRLIKVIDATGTITVMKYDAVGNLQQVTDPNGNGYTYEYDGLGRITEISNALAEKTKYEYDALGNIKKFTDASGRYEEYWYDANNRLVTAGNPFANNYITLSYDPKGNLLSVNDSKGGLMQFTYDILNRLSTVTPQSGLYSLQYTYDNVGNIIRREDENGVKTNYTYDTNNRIKEIQYPIGNITFNHDAQGNLISAANNNIGINDSVNYTYDKLDRVLNITVDYGSFEKILKYQYDELGNIINMTDLENGLTQYKYDPLNRIINITNPTNDIITFEYDNASRRTKIVYPENQYTTYLYDNANRILNITNKKSDNSIITSYNYTYDAVGNRLSTKDNTGNLTTYIYDQVNRISTVNYPNGDNISYTYDGNNNIFSKTINGVLTTYSYDSENRLTSDGTFSYTYDNIGNRASKSNVAATTLYSYNYEDQLTSITLSDSSTVNYTYSPFWDRISKTNSTGISYYFYDKEDLLMEFDNIGTIIARYTHGPLIDEPLIINRESINGYYHFDGLGSVTALSNITEQVINSYGFDAFGGLRSETETIENPYEFTARRDDEEIGLYYYRFRSYDPVTGGFLQKDPLGIKEGMNLYAYVNNNPINFVDPYGEQPSTAMDERCLRQARKRYEAKINGLSPDEWKNPNCDQLQAEFDRIDKAYKTLQKASKDLAEAEHKKIVKFVGGLITNVVVAVTSVFTGGATGVLYCATLSAAGAGATEYVASGDVNAAVQEAGLAGTVGAATGNLDDITSGVIGEGINAARGSDEPDVPNVSDMGPINDLAYVRQLMNHYENYKAWGKMKNLVDRLLRQLERQREAAARRLQACSYGEGAAANAGLDKLKAELAADQAKCRITLTRSAPSSSYIDPAPDADPEDDPSEKPAPPKKDPVETPRGGSKGEGANGESQGWIFGIGYNPLEPEDPEGPWWPIWLPGPFQWPLIPITITPNGGGGWGEPPGEGGYPMIDPPPGYCEYRVVYFSNDAINDQGDNQQALYNSIKWAAKETNTTQTYVLIMPSYGGYDGWTDWLDFDTAYPDIIVTRWSGEQSERETITYSGLKIRNADVLVDSDHALTTQQGGYYSTDEIQAIQSYLEDEHGYIATFGTLDDNAGQNDQTTQLMSLLGLNNTGNDPTKYTNSNPWEIDNRMHPIFKGISSGWNPGDVTGNVDIGVCPRCDEKHLGSRLGHLESSTGNHHAVISAYQLWFAPQSEDGLLGTSTGDCVNIHNTVYFGNRIIDNTGNNHDALYNAIKWTAKHDNNTDTKVLIMPGWGGYDGWSLWQAFNTTYSDINITRWSDQQFSRNTVTIHGLDATDADVLIDSNHSSPTIQGGFYDQGELQALEWYVKTRGHGYIATHGTLGENTGQTTQTNALLELLGLEKTGTIDTYSNSNTWTIDQPYHPIIYGLNSWNPGDVTGEIDVDTAVKIAHLSSTSGNHHSLIAVNEGLGRAACVCNCSDPQVDYIRITDAPNGTEILDQQIDNITTIPGVISAYNNSIGFIGVISVGWSIENNASNATTAPLMGTASMFNSGYRSGAAVWWADDGYGHYDNVSFEIDLNDPPVFGIPSPANGSTNQPLTLNWSIPINDPEGDLFNWSIECNNGQTNQGTGASNGTKSLFLTGLDFLTTYTIWVNATAAPPSNIIARAWFEFTTQGNNPPHTPSTPSPANHATDVDINADLSWTGGDPDPSDIVTYDVYFGASSNPPMVSNNQTNINYDPGTMSYTTIYYWKIVSWDNQGASTSGPLWDFTTMAEPNDPPYPPSDPNPLDGATDVSIEALLSWACSDPNGDPLVYDVYFEADDPTPDILVSDDQTATTYDPGTLDYETTYYWQIIAKDIHSATTDGPVWHFTTEETPNEPPNPPSITGRINGEAGTAYSYTFIATDPDDDDVSYYIEWGDGDITDWTTPQASGPPGYSESHIWDIEDSYTIRAKAKDSSGAESDWGTLAISMPLNQGSYPYPLLYKILQLFPNLFPVLRQLMGL